MKYDIFISYRREGGLVTAKHIYDLLSIDGYSVSFDIDTLRNGDFDTALLNRINECTDFILILDAHAFDRTLDPSFPKEKDWLYQELLHALKQNKNIIPIMLSGFAFPDNLPDDIKKVQKKNGPIYDIVYFDAFYQRLKTYFKTSAPKASAISNRSNGLITFVLKITVDETSLLYIDDKKIRKIKQGTTAIINTLKYGYRYKITLKNLAINKEEYTIEYEVPDKRVGDEINVEFKKMREQRIAAEKEERQKKEEQREKRNMLTYTLRTLCRENYDWFDHICYNTVRVKRDGRFGFLDMNGVEIVPCVLNNATNFEGDYAYVFNGEKWGIINNSGQLIIDFNCDKSSWISNGFTALLQNNKQVFVNLQEPENLYGPYDEILVTENSNRFIVRTQQNYYIIDECNNKLNNDAFERFFNDNEGSMDKSEKIIFFPLIVAHKRRGWINNLDNNQDEPDLCGVVNQDGEYIIPCKMEAIELIQFVQYGNLNKRYFKIKTNSNYGIYDISTQAYSIPPIYKALIPSYYIVDEITSWLACDNNSKWGAVNINNIATIPFKYDDCQPLDDWIQDISYEIKPPEVWASYTWKDSFAFFKLLSDERFTLKIKNEGWFHYTREQYRYCIIVILNSIFNHIIVCYPFEICCSWDKSFYARLIEPSDESLSGILSKIKEEYYTACCDLYGKEEAQILLERFMQCEDCREIEENASIKISLQSIFQNAEDAGKKEVLFPEISIICSQSSETAYNTLTAEICRIRDIFSQNGFSCKAKDIIIVLLTDDIYRNDEVINEVNSITNCPNQAIFVGSRPLFDDNNDKHILERWIKNQTFYQTWNVFNDKEKIVLKIFALLNGWDCAESDWLF